MKKNKKIDFEDKETENEIHEIIDEIEKKKRKKVSITLGFLLHKQFMIHLGLSLFINYALAAMVLGLAIGIRHPLMKINLLGFFIGILLLTVVENFVKILLLKYIYKIMAYSFGILNVVIQILILYLISAMMPKTFMFNGLSELIAFSIIFSGLRLIVSTYLRSYLYHEKIVFWR